MLNTIIGIKGEMKSGYDTRGQRIPVTVLRVEPNVIAQLRDKKVLLGFGTKKQVKKTDNKFITDLGYAPKFRKEVKSEGEIKIGDKITVSLFAKGDAVKVTGISKGKGFAGGIKRWGFHGGPKTHGQSDRHRAPGSIGQGTTPGRVLKGKKMAGHYGSAQSTTIGLEVIEVDIANNLLLVKGAVPGAKNGYLIIEKTGKVKRYIAPPEEKPDEDEGEGEGEKKTEGKSEDGDKPKGEEKPQKTEQKDEGLIESEPEGSSLRVERPDQSGGKDK
ncbi:MAG: 50S ribosomal protein L3 [Candidatus Curtissbacteria bacterium]|nr:50S ribosomal protein L3 [Candidatus Curtissbacteria bacterium]